MPALPWSPRLAELEIHVEPKPKGLRVKWEILQNRKKKGSALQPASSPRALGITAVQGTTRTLLRGAWPPLRAHRSGESPGLAAGRAIATCPRVHLPLYFQTHPARPFTPREGPSTPRPCTRCGSCSRAQPPADRDAAPFTAPPTTQVLRGTSCAPPHLDVQFRFR